MISIKKRLFLILFMMLTMTAKAQITFPELDVKMKREPKNIVIFISSERCAYCLMQEKRLKNNHTLNGRLNSEVYFVAWKVDEQKKFIFNGKPYISGMEFIREFNKGEAGFPFWIVFDKNYQVVYTYAGLMQNSSLMKMLDAVQ